MIGDKNYGNLLTHILLSDRMKTSKKVKIERQKMRGKKKVRKKKQALNRGFT